MRRVVTTTTIFCEQCLKQVPTMYIENSVQFKGSITDLWLAFCNSTCRQEWIKEHE